MELKRLIDLGGRRESLLDELNSLHHEIATLRMPGEVQSYSNLVPAVFLQGYSPYEVGVTVLQANSEWSILSELQSL